MTKKLYEDDIWIGLVEVQNIGGCNQLGDLPGAYVTAIVRCDSESVFKEKCQKALTEDKMSVVEIEWCLPLNDRLDSEIIEDYLLDRADLVRQHEYDILFGNFHAWE